MRRNISSNVAVGVDARDSVTRRRADDASREVVRRLSFLDYRTAVCAKDRLCAVMNGFAVLMRLVVDLTADGACARMCRAVVRVYAVLVRRLLTRRVFFSALADSPVTIRIVLITVIYVYVLLRQFFDDGSFLELRAAADTVFIARIAFGLCRCGLRIAYLRAASVRTCSANASTIRDVPL